MAHTEFPVFLNEHLRANALPVEIGAVLTDIVAGCLAISKKVRLGALAGVLGEAGSGNIQGEAQKKLDVIANDILVETLRRCPHIAGLASEEEDDFVAANAAGEYLVLFDPLDGSSNIDVNISVGTIFSVLRKPHDGAAQSADFLQCGTAQMAAGYVLYGVQTQLVLTLGHGVFAFTLDDQGQFILTRSRLNVPAAAAEFAINMSNYRHWEEPVRVYIDELLAGESGVRGKNYNMRWVASMVAEVHRILMRGGVFMYPKDARDPSKPGKLRLMYEANPMSWLITQAGGAASDARQAILTIQPQSLHQRVAVILGAQEEVTVLADKHRAA
ncbi:MAG: class 1 fructose-bisphosphatase [Neisseria sp.]|nr:class 1 fructose-bisphosphatase [Neisseria sp.]